MSSCQYGQVHPRGRSRSQYLRRRHQALAWQCPTSDDDGSYANLSSEQHS